MSSSSLSADDRQFHLFSLSAFFPSSLTLVFICIFFFFNIFVFCFFKLFIYLFIYLWLCWVFVSVWGLSLVVASGGHSSSRCAGLSSSQPLLLRSTGSRRAGSVVVAHGPSCSAACGIFPDQGPNLCPLHWQAASQPLRHPGSPVFFFICTFFCIPQRKCFLPFLRGSSHSVFKYCILLPIFTLLQYLTCFFC